jgi:hypothetical protein
MGSSEITEPADWFAFGFDCSLQSAECRVPSASKALVVSRTTTSVYGIISELRNSLLHTSTTWARFSYFRPPSSSDATA